MRRLNLHPQFKQLLLFLAILVGMNGVITLYFYTISTRNHKLIKFDRAFHNAPDQVDYLIMGNSRAFRAIDRSKLKHSVLFGSGGEGNIFSHYKLEYALEKSEKEIRTVLMPAEFSSINLPNPLIFGNSFYWKRYVNYLKLGHETGDYETYFSIWIKSKTVPWYEYPYIRISMVTGEYEPTIDKSGFESGSENDRLEMARKMARQNNAVNQLYHSLSVQYIQKTIELCRKNRCNLVYIKFPLSTYFQKAVDELPENDFLEKQEKRVDAIMSNAKGVLFLDYEHIFDQHPEYFRDPHHLNDRGRELFTKKLIQDLNANGL